MAIGVDSLLAVLEDPAPEENWAKAEPVKGDHIRVRRIGGLYYHHGIYVSDDEVISFAGDDDYNPVDWWDTEIQATSFEQFRQGGEIEVRKYTEKEAESLCDVDDTIAFARACLGNKDYDLLFHNCEHFANACKLGVYRSQQTENLHLGDALTKAIQCLWDEDARRQWFTEAWEDLKAQVQDKLRRDKEKEDKDEGEGD